MKVEYRVRCSQHTAEGHRMHRYRVANEAKGVMAVGELNAQPSRDGCRPWVLEVRGVSEWTNDLTRFKRAALFA